VAYWFIRSRIPFAKVILKTVTRIIIKFNGTIVAAFIGMLISAVFSVLWLATFVGMLEFLAEKGQGRGAFIGLLILML
jgi:hypothetical protein